jgi:uncharacterized protein YqjF (DUF2071 family)
MLQLPNALRASLARPPEGSWRWSQQWLDVVFLHWPVDAAALQSRLPGGLTVDTFEDQAWVSFVGFWLRRVRLWGLPPVPWCSDCLELNVRTYVRSGGDAGICFLNMHANHCAMVAAARLLTPLPYARATIAYEAEERCKRFLCHPTAASSPLLDVQFTVGGVVGSDQTDALDHWLVERYLAIVPDTRGGVLRMPAAHETWPLRSIALEKCRVEGDHLACGASGEPARAHYSDGVHASLWPFSATSAH